MAMAGRDDIFQDVIRVFQLALPNDDYISTEFGKSSLVFPIIGKVAVKFGLPPFGSDLNLCLPLRSLPASYKQDGLYLRWSLRSLFHKSEIICATFLLLH